MKAIIVDLDNTLCNIKYKKDLVEKKPKDFQKFYELIPNDTVNIWCEEIINKFIEDTNIIIVTGRMNQGNILKDTMNWLEKNNIPYDSIHMRKNNDFRNDWKVKPEIVAELMKEYEILFCLEDRRDVTAKYREMGLTVLQCDYEARDEK